MTWKTTLSCALFVGPLSGRGGSSTPTLKNLMIKEFLNVQYVRKKWWVNARWKGINRVTRKKVVISAGYKFPLTHLAITEQNVRE